jgi:tetratricopeptide (TPR) repeat protein
VLNPDHTEADLLYGRLLEAIGEFGRGLAAKQKALERDPFSGLVHLQIALSCWIQRRYDGVIEWANKALELDPRHLLAREFIAGAYWKKGDFDRQMTECIAHAECYGAPAEVLNELAEVYARGGRRRLVEHTIERAATQPPNAVQLALLHGELGNMDDAFRHLEVAIEQRDPCLVLLAVAPQWDSLREDPRFAACLTRMGLTAPG